MKNCNHCQQTKSVSEFHKNRAMKDGFANYCRKCMNAYNSNFISEMRICSLPECCAVFLAQSTKTMFCHNNCYRKARDRGLKAQIITLENSPCKLPWKSFIGAEEMECVVL